MSESGAGRNVALMGKPAKERRVAGDSYVCMDVDRQTKRNIGKRKESAFC